MANFFFFVVFDRALIRTPNRGRGDRMENTEMKNTELYMDRLLLTVRHAMTVKRDLRFMPPPPTRQLCHSFFIYFYLAACTVLPLLGPAQGAGQSLIERGQQTGLKNADRVLYLGLFLFGAFFFLKDLPRRLESVPLKLGFEPSSRKKPHPNPLFHQGTVFVEKLLLSIIGGG